jgi:hypothetical protein
MLCEGAGIKPNFFPLSCMTVRANFCLVASRNHFPLSNVFRIASLIGLGALFVMETEERAIFFERLVGNKPKIGIPYLQWKRPAFVKSLMPAAGLSFGFLLVCL